MSGSHRPILVGKEWLDHAASGARFDVINPATGEAIASLPQAAAVETAAAVDAATSAQQQWAAVPAPERAQILRRTHDLLVASADDLARTITSEHGKPLAEARAEVSYGASFVRWFAGEAERVYGRIVPSNDPTRRIIVSQRPVGVVGAITPWNFPIAMVLRKVAPALAAGCAVVLKPSELTPLVALDVAQIFLEAGLPPGALSVVCGTDSAAIGSTMMADERVRKVTFTGSTRVGKLLIEQSAATVKRLSLELGGNAPFLIFDDADLDAALEGLVVAKMRNAGQSCIAANRILVQRGVAAELTSRLVEKMAKLKVGDGLDLATAVGPLINAAAVEKVSRHVGDAVARGAVLELGGTAPSSLFFEPTVLSGVTDEMAVAQEETFGPVAAISVFDTEEEVIARANDSRAGLAAYYYTRDIARVVRLSERLEYGIHGVNDGFVSVAQAPFGGHKESGLGREGGAEGITEFLESTYLSVRV